MDLYYLINGLLNVINGLVINIFNGLLIKLLLWFQFKFKF